MGRHKHSAVRKYHDRVAHVYDETYSDEYWQWHDTLTWDYLKRYLPRDANATVMDLGCGTGKWACRLLKTGYRVVCVDISPKMLEQARQHVERLGMSNRAVFIQADLADLDALPRGEAALAVAYGDAIGCTESPPATLKQIRRLLTDGGVLSATFDNRLAAMDFYLASKDPRSLARFLHDGKTHWLTRDAAEQFEIRTFTPTDLTKLIHVAGFEILEMVGKTVLPMRNHRELLKESDDRRFWAKIEKSLSRDAAALGRAAHLQVACRVRKR